MFIVHLTNCVDNVDDEKRAPAKKKDSHNDAHLMGWWVMAHLTSYKNTLSARKQRLISPYSIPQTWNMSWAITLHIDSSSLMIIISKLLGFSRQHSVLGSSDSNPVFVLFSWNTNLLYINVTPATYACHCSKLSAAPKTRPHPSAASSSWIFLCHAFWVTFDNSPSSATLPTTIKIWMGGGPVWPSVAG